MKSNLIPPQKLWLALLFFCLLLVITACSSSSTSEENISATHLLATSLPAPTTTSTPCATPTPRPTRQPPTQLTRTYTVQAGDTLSGIAAYLGISVEELLVSNGLTDADQLQSGQLLKLPVQSPVVGPKAVLLPDSELVYGPAYANFELTSAITPYSGYFQTYTEALPTGEVVTGPEIIMRIAMQYSVGPRVLLALLEAESGWLTNPHPSQAACEYPLGHVRDGWEGLTSQLLWTADDLNAGFYGWLFDDLWTFRLADRSSVQFATTINAGTAGVQRSLADSADFTAFQERLQKFETTYYRLWGDPFSYTGEPLLPPVAAPPTLALPWSVGETWYFTGGPHGGWGEGSARAALDFATSERNWGCRVSEQLVTAVTAGQIAYSREGLILQELDHDGFIGTGWVLIYMHLAAQDRVVAGAQVELGDALGHPSCEGGPATASHLHFARRYNGVWIPADSPWPLVLSGWRARAGARSYDGSLQKGELIKTAEEDWLSANAILHLR
ncbi:MAG: LysM peptidoglycan-binding domain-containing M23 family metallopeptidase [Chloroflexota bacterium]|nr:LysM peptidoglycan-binding domain-containing M23 family metallopeptidase [Chloroflexota bacterium]